MPKESRFRWMLTTLSRDIQLPSTSLCMRQCSETWLYKIHLSFGSAEILIKPALKV